MPLTKMTGQEAGLSLTCPYRVESEAASAPVIRFGAQRVRRQMGGSLYIAKLRRESARPPPRDRSIGHRDGGGRR